MAKKMNPRVGTFCGSTCKTWLVQALLTVFLVSVGLNVFLIFFRHDNLQESRRSAAGTAHLVYDNLPVVPKSRKDIPRQKVYVITRLQDGKKKADTLLHVHDNLQQNEPKKSQPETSQPAKVKKSQPETSQPTKVKNQQKTTTIKVSASLNKSMPACPLSPPGLIGPLRALTKDIKPNQLRKLFPDLERGGRIRPMNCVPRERLAVIIPFRDRYPHLYILLNNLIPFLRRQLVDATIFIIEQAPPTTFNRGALLNVGFLEALKVADFDCFILHDVDLIPLNDRNFYRCGSNPRHFAVAMNKHRFRLMYESYFGGVVGMSKDQYVKVNGNSNLYFGWGGEDDDLYLRIANKNYTMDRYDNQTARYLMIKHTRDKGNDKNSERRRMMNSATRRQDIEGLNTTKYKVNNITYDHLHTWINVSLDMNDIIQTAPNYTLHDIWKLLRDLKLQKLE